MVKILRELIVKMQLRFSPFVDDAVQIISKTLLDSYQEIKKESCLVVESLCDTVPQAVALHGGAISKAVLVCVKHKHSNVRIVGLKSLARALLVDASAIDDCFEQIKELNRDKSPAVREQLYIFARDLMVQLMDRHVYGHKILPLLYGGLKDEMPKLVLLCQGFMDQAGERYEKDNQDRIKDEMDYTDGHERPGRPRVGSRYVARDNTKKIVDKQVELLGDWNADTRMKAAQVLSVFLEFTESNITGYVNLLLPAVYKILAGDEEFVMEEAKKLMKKLGEFVTPDTCLSLMLPALKSGGGGLSTFRLGCLRALQGVLAGSSSALITPLLPNLIAELSDRELITSESMAVTVELSKCVCSIGDKLSTDRDVQFRYFYLAVQLKSIPGNEKLVGYTDLQKTVDEVFELLARNCASPTIEHLYRSFLSDAVATVAQTYEHWTQYSLESRALETLLKNSADGYITIFDKLIPLFNTNVTTEKDFELRERMLLLALELFVRSKPVHTSTLEPHALLLFFKDVALKNCIWKAGRKALHLRSIAVQLVNSMIYHLKEHTHGISILEPLFDSDILPVVLTNLDDDQLSTRRDCLFILDSLLPLKFFKGTLYSNVAESFKKVYPELLKRMDDAKDDIRIQVGSTWEYYFESISQWRNDMQSVKQSLPEEEREQCAIVHPETKEIIEIDIECSHFETILDGLFVHLDDGNVQVQVFFLNDRRLRVKL
jgi:dynein assembly factor 5, axonemal